MGKILLILLSLSFSSAHAYELPAKLQKMVGATFSKPGPNCFAAALYGSDVYDSFRGVSENEFSEVLKSSCEKVEEPMGGDIGVYQSKDFSFVHAFVYLDEKTAFEKPGVDYVGQTPVRIQAQESIDYVHIASLECRRYGDESCHNTKSYYRCGVVNSNLKPNPKFDELLAKINEVFDAVLIEGDLSLETQAVIGDIYWRLEYVARSDLEKAIVESVEKQFQFFKFNFDEMRMF